MKINEFIIEISDFCKLREQEVRSLNETEESLENRILETLHRIKTGDIHDDDFIEDNEDYSSSLDLYNDGIDNGDFIKNIRRSLIKGFRLNINYYEFFSKIMIDDKDVAFGKTIEVGFAHDSAGIFFGLSDRSDGIFLNYRRIKKIYDAFDLNNSSYKELNRKILPICRLNNHVFLFIWSGRESNEILLFDKPNNTISRVSNSLDNFLTRGLECLLLELEQDLHSPSAKALEIISRIDGDNVLPNLSSIYKIENIDEFPKEWKSIISADCESVKEIKIDTKRLNLPALKHSKYLEKYSFQSLILELGITYKDLSCYFCDGFISYNTSLYDNLLKIGEESPFSEIALSPLRLSFYPPVFSKLRFLGRCYDGYLCYWEDLGLFGSEILFYTPEYHNEIISIFSYSMANFLCRGLEHKYLDLALKDDINLDKKIIEKYENNIVMSKSVTYGLSHLEKWPKHWQEFLTEKDYAYE